ncbi:hypothetical protein Tco_0084542 [Tanacetum coccineum]
MKRRGAGLRRARKGKYWVKSLRRARICYGGQVYDVSLRNPWSSLYTTGREPWIVSDLAVLGSVVVYNGPRNDEETSNQIANFHLVGHEV